MQKFYKNPVWDGYFADPFVLKVGRNYYAYGTGPASPDGRVFPVLYSTDLIQWTPRGGALEPIAQSANAQYWAPEVIEKEGRFYMYYSASLSGNDEDHRLRVAIADDPAGPFKDAGRVLFDSLGFTIDASPFFDPASRRHFLYFATDYVGEHPTGTGLGVVPLTDDLLAIAGEPQVVTRATAPWQVYESNRNYKGRIWEQWYCVEGPSVIFREGIYYCLYSGGAWRTPGYGVGFATAKHPLGPWRDDMAIHGPTVLKGIEGKVIGPGHNSVVLGPDGKTDFIVYHAWDRAGTARKLCIDPLRWTESGPRADGPSFEERAIEMK
jgi:beta-xylosidase